MYDKNKGESKVKTGERIKGEDLLGKTLEVCEGGMLKVVEDKFPQVGGQYWLVKEIGKVECHRWDEDEMDLFIAKYNRIFPNEKLAKEYAKYLKKKAELSFEPNWGDKNQKKYFFWYNGEDENKWGFDYTLDMHVGNTLYFPSKQCSKILVDKFGIEKLLYFEFGIPMSQEN